jgi:diaminopimelate decarboxylase
MNFSHKDIEIIEAKYGTPFYVLKLDRFKHNFNEFLQSFRDIYPNTQIAYSYKTNYIPQLCKVVNELGGWAEVVSEMEYELAARIGVAPTHIVFNGPYKNFRDIETALLGGSIVNLDSFYEIDILKKIAGGHSGRRFGIGLRVNFQYREEVEMSRFGFNVENGSFVEALEKIRGLDNISLDGLHCHFMVPGKCAKGYRQITQNMLELYNEYFAGQSIRYIDIGGGFFGPMPPELASQFEEPVASFADYSRAIATQFAEFFSTVKCKPLLVLEPGIALTADTMDFVTKIIDVKPAGAKKFVLVNGSIYDIKPTLNTKNLPMEIVTENAQEGRSAKFDIVGHTCMEGDFLARDVEGIISQGDYVIFKNTGAYTVVLRPPFIRPAPPIVSLVNDKWEQVRGRGQFADIFDVFGMF